MGINAEDMVDGTTCSGCGCYFVDDEGGLYTHGYPVLCEGCYEPGGDTPKANVDTF